MAKQVGISRFTDYGSPCLKNGALKKKIGTESPLLYRMYLQDNAKSIMNDNFVAAYNSNILECECKICLNGIKKPQCADFKCKLCGKNVGI